MANTKQNKVNKKQLINTKISSIKKRRQDAAKQGDKLNVQSLDIDLSIANTEAQKAELQKQKERLTLAKKREVQKKKVMKKREEDNKVSEGISLNNIQSFADFVYESETSEYEPPKFLVLPALDPDTQEPNDKMDAYMRGEAKKKSSYFMPGISSANPPYNNFEDNEES